MKKYFLFFAVIICILPAIVAQEPLKLWYSKPANLWVEALPLGNGHIGAMVFGGVENELIQLNESTLYSGGPVKKKINPSAAAILPQVREALLKDEDYSKAAKLTQKMQGLYTESYLPMGDIMIKQNFNGQQPTSYYRDLDLENASSVTKFTIAGVSYTREVFISAPAFSHIFHKYKIL